MGQAQTVIDTAANEIGYREGYSDGHWNNQQKYSPAVPGLEWSQGQPWCHTFVSWVFRTAELNDLAPVTASCAQGVQWFKGKGQFSRYPAVGAVIYFGSDGGRHVGIVERYDADNVYTIEGNTNQDGSAEGDGVYRKTRQRRDLYVYGYGYPAYAEGIDSADPHFTTQSGADTGAGASGRISTDEIDFSGKGSWDSGKTACTGHIKEALRIMGLPEDHWLGGMLTIAERETAHNSPRWQVNTTDSNARNTPELFGGRNAPDGHPGMCSRGMIQAIPQTFAQYHQAGTSTKIYDPVASAAAGINYIIDRYHVQRDGSNLTAKVQQADPNRPPKGY
ncbi:CHAP domain-containing protein [Streptomyces yunnanensis]|uniref:CHAP domain-containing protein n=1 Tax=Streptomyces yunnanensis TaxID=156453 RepID=A0A9X8N9B8_9ACTN|nr:CHAP domain-containing protein [Streptomyces yunnanensis]SHN32555.1 CHAP domain-containing protein [Streptomyces yunnanensis]